MISYTPARIVKKEQRKTQTVVENLHLTPERVKEWKLPSMQRPEYMNAKIRAVATEMIHNGGIWPGVVTLGVLDNDKSIYLVDGQQRRAAFLLAVSESGLTEGRADVRTCFFRNEIAMAKEFVHLQSHLVRMRSDDLLRGVESSVPILKEIRNACPFVGYTTGRTGGKQILSMSVALRAWYVSAYDNPSQFSLGVDSMARLLTAESGLELIKFLTIFDAGVGRDKTYSRLWGHVNLAICMWLYRRIVIPQPNNLQARHNYIDAELFKKCLMTLSSLQDYLAWLSGRSLTKDRGPAYARVKAALAKRIAAETGEKAKLPSPDWAG